METKPAQPTASSFPHAQVHHTFKKLSKWIIITPILFVMIGLVIAPPRQKANNVQHVVPTRMPTGAIIPTQSLTQAKILQQLTAISPASTATKSATVQLNLIGPFVCNYQNEGTSFKAYIKNKQVSVQVPVETGAIQHIVLNADCVYAWQQGDAVGTKMCGMSQYLALFSTMSQYGMMDTGSILGTVAQMVPSAKKIDTAQLARACVKEEVNNTVFTIPTNVKFSESTTQAF